MERVYSISVFVFLLNLSMFSQINDIKTFLDQCPTNDPVIDTILKDFEIRINGQKVTGFPCFEPVSAMSTVTYSNPLIYLQTLRVIYYMDRNMSSPHLPWTDTTLYVWMKNGVDGISIRDGVSGGYCCEMIEGKKFFVTGNQNDANREFDKKWIGISGNIDFFVHEVKHTDGSGYPHSSCCGIANGCDPGYNESDLGAYGVQYWLIKSWLTGLINVGARASHSAAEINEIINWHLSALNVSRNRFCSNIPPVININDIPNPLGTITNSEENIDAPEVNLFPNPVISGGSFTLSVPGNTINKIEIFTVNGLLLKTIQDRMVGEVTISTKGLKPDIYILKIEAGNNKVHCQKLIIR